MKYLLAVFLLIYVHECFGEALNSSLVRQYDRMVCENEPTCSLVNHFSIPQERRSLDKRNCMCDAECVEYRDCCYDSPTYELQDQIQPQLYYCPPTINVYMKTNCPVWWTDDYIARQCEKSIQPLDSEDVMLILPVTNTDTGITYGNAFCAYCHNDRNFQPWILVPSCVPTGPVNTSREEPQPQSQPQPVPQPQPEPQPQPLYNTNNAGISIFISTPFPSSFLVPSPPVQTVVDVYLFQQFITSSNGNLMPLTPVTVSTSYMQNGVQHYAVRRSRQAAFNQYSAYQKPFDSNEVWKYAKFDTQSRRFISTYEGNNFVCEIGPKLPDDLRSYTRTCVPNLIETCLPGTDAVQLQYCRESTSIVYNKYTKRAYRNKFCAFCNCELKVYLTGCVEKTEDEFFRNYQPSFGGLYGGIDPCSRHGAAQKLNCPKK